MIVSSLLRFVRQHALVRATAVAGCLCVSMAACHAPASAAPAAAEAKNADLIIYHMEGRRSFRIIWLCEELGIPYKLIMKAGDLQGSAALLHNANPLMPMYPSVDLHGQILVESGGIIETLLARHGHGRLMPALSSPDLPYYYQWLHFAEGTGMARIFATRFAATVANIPVTQVPSGYDRKVPGSGMIGVKAVLAFMDDFLSKHPYFGGQQFSAADIMMHFVARGSGPAAGVPSSDYPNIVAWRKKVQERPAFKRAMDAGFPNGYDENGNGCGLPKPFADPPAVFECKK